MSAELILSVVMMVSLLTSLFTECIKRILTEKKVKYSSNIVAVSVAAILSLVVGVGYVIWFELAITAKVIVSMVAMMLLSALSSMLGYDKVIQAIGQIKRK